MIRLTLKLMRCGAIFGMLIAIFLSGCQQPQPQKTESVSVEKKKEDKEKRQPVLSPKATPQDVQDYLKKSFKKGKLGKDGEPVEANQPTETEEVKSVEEPKPKTSQKEGGENEGKIASTSEAGEGIEEETSEKRYRMYPETSLYNPDPGAYAGETVPENLMTMPLPEVPKYGMDPLPKKLKLPREGVKLNKWRMSKFKAEESFLEEGLPAHTRIADSRWDVRYEKSDRYPEPDRTEAPLEFSKPYIFHPYKQSVLKGDVPILGENVFLKITADSDSILEFLRIPTPSGISAADPDRAEFYGDGDVSFLQQNFFLTIDLFKGETEVFKPVSWLLRLQPVYNVNYFETSETNVLQPDTRGDNRKDNEARPTIFDFSNPATLTPGIVRTFFEQELDKVDESFESTRYVTRLRDFWTFQEGFFELHLLDVSDTYDFISTRHGLQTFNSDFRGLIFFDTNLGFRLFGNAENNLWQYNVAYFNLREKDTNSELNKFDQRDQEVYIANLYRQDFFFPGYNVNWSALVNVDNGKKHFDENGFIARPAPVGSVQEHDVRSYYAGFSGEGKWGRVNISHSFYQAFGSDELNGISGRRNYINAQQAHLELSYDRDWIRFKGTAFYASGDSNPEDNKAAGFDTIIDNPNLIGGPFSYYARQGFNLGGSLVRLKQRNSLVPNLRTSKFEGQSNFVNPGVIILGLGSDVELTPENRLFFNANYIRFADTATIKQVLFTNDVNEELGYDLSVGIISRPLLTDNILISAGFGAFIPGEGYRDIYEFNRDPVPTFDEDSGLEFQDFLYSAFIELTLTW